jgi:site-specific DNA-methyltransferase (adenine-specific)
MAVVCGDCRIVLPTLPEASFDGVVTDPPYGIGFMGKKWDTPGALVEREADRSQKWDNVGGNHNPSTGIDQARTRCAEGRKFGEWCGTWLPAVSRVLKPGGYMLAMGGTRTYHRLACAVEDAGFEIRDCLMWMYGTGFPKGQGCLKPAWEPILLCRKPGPKVLPLGVDACRISCEERHNIVSKPKNGEFAGVFREGSSTGGTTRLGRYPANVLHDGSDEVMEAFAAFGERGGGDPRKADGTRSQLVAEGWDRPWRHGEQRKEGHEGFSDTGTAARFFYAAKASKAERGKDNTHPTVKPLALMRWMVRLVTPEGGRVLDPFAGSGSTLVAASMEGREAVGIELDEVHCTTARRRVRDAMGTGLLAGVV